jgi:hypothetical protein
MTANVHPLPPRPDAVLATLNILNARLATIAGVVLHQLESDDKGPDWQLETISRALGLDAFEQQALLFVAAAELHSDTRALVAKIGDGPPSVALVLRVCEGLSWHALRPDGALRRGSLVRIGNGEGRFTERPVWIEEPVLLALNGVVQLDPALTDIALPASTFLPAEHPIATLSPIAAQMAQTPNLPLEVVEDDLHAGAAFAISLLREMGLAAVVLPVSRLPTDPASAARFRKLWLRDSLIHGLGLVLLADAPSAPDVAQHFANWSGPLTIVSRGDISLFGPSVRVTVPIGRSSRLQTWQAALGEEGVACCGPILERMAFAFSLSAADIGAITARYPQADGETLWQAAREAARPRDDGLVERFEPKAKLADIILPPDAKSVLDTVVNAARAHHKVSAEWGSGEKGVRGLGITALFSGESGTGKTMAAEGIAHALKVDLYRVEVSAVVSKYIGETEKNLRRIFAAAQASGGVLLFDEADTMFGKRSDVKDAHDRYANLEVGYLLQQMESYRGIAILTTNMTDALDTAFLRRLRFVIPFPLPGQAERAQIWSGAFPSAVQTKDIVPEKLARLAITGGMIHNIALGAGLRAAGHGGPISMADVLASARSEYMKMNRSLGDIEGRDWS